MTNPRSDVGATTLGTASGAPVAGARVLPELAAQLRALFDKPHPGVVPSGVLAWFGSTSFPDGVTNVPTLAPLDWMSCYTRLESAALDTKILTPLQTLITATNAFPTNGPVPIAIANVELSVPTAAFQQCVQEAVANGTALRPPPSSLESVIEPAHAFLATTFMHSQFGLTTPVVRGRTTTFVIDEKFYSTNRGGPLPTELQLDVGDGQGFRAVAWREEVPATYAAAGSFNVAVRCRYGDAQLEGRTTVLVSDEAAVPPPNETWRLVGSSPTITGKAYVFRASGHDEVINPLIVAEGFPGGYPYDYVYDALSGNGLLATLFAKGYDLIIVSFDDGTDLIQHNAQIVEACVAEALRRVRARDAANQPLIVGGVSMGGLVARFALASMETRGVDHGARIFFTIDSPHGGAYTTIGDQWLLHYLQPASSLSRQLAALVDSPANQQFMTLWVRGLETIVSPMRTQLLRDFKSVGDYPQKPRRIAVANGRGDGQRSVAAGAPLVQWTGSPFAYAELNALTEGTTPEIVARGYCLRADADTPPALRAASAVSWEGAPGGQNVYNAMTADVATRIDLGTVTDLIPVTTAVATLSALDIDPARYGVFAPVPPPESGASPFHDYICGTENTQHITITPETSIWLAAQFGDPPTGGRS